MISSGSPEAMTCVVTGASSPVGSQLVKLLIAQGSIVHAIGRGAVPGEDFPRCIWQQCDLSDSHPLPNFVAQRLFHVASIWLLPNRVEQFYRNGVRRVIAFSSTSRLSKADSTSSAERAVAESLARSEEQVMATCERLGMVATIFRPTLIYGDGRDRNVTDIARVAKRFGVFPILGRGIGLRQPVHVEDLAQACILASDASKSFNRIYNLSGGETLTYRCMVERIFQAMGKPSRVVSVPEALFRLTILLARLSSKFKHLKPEMAKRMDHDLCFDHSPAVQDFGYSPRPFLPDSKALGLK